MSTSIDQRTTMSPRSLVAHASGVVAASCFAVHAVLVVVAGASMLGTTAPMLVLSGLCLGCIASAGRPWERAAHVAAGVASAVMVVAHLVLMSSEPGAAAHHERHGGMDMGQSGGGSIHLLMHVGVVLAGLQLVLLLGSAARQHWTNPHQSSLRKRFS